jgi:hypothetical protein
MNPGVDRLDPLELALLLEAAEDLADLDRHDPPPGRQPDAPAHSRAWHRSDLTKTAPLTSPGPAWGAKDRVQEWLSRSHRS